MNQHESSQEKMHKEILKQFTFDEHKHKTYEKRKVNLVVSLSACSEVVLPQKQQQFVSNSGLNIYPEFVEYCYFLEGCSKKLFFYLLFHHINNSTGEFKFNKQIETEFKQYDLIMTNNSNTYSGSTLKSAFKKLVKHNLITSVKRGTYMLNPMIMCAKSADYRRTMINNYSLLVHKKKKNSANGFFPLRSIDIT